MHVGARNDARDLNLSKSWYLIELCTVALHAGSMLVIPLVVIYYAFHMQHIWALLMCPPDGIHGTWPALWYDLFNSYLVWSPSFDTVEPGEADQNRHTLLLVRMICVEAVAFMALAILRLTLHYLSFPPSRAVRIFKAAFGVVLGLHILWVFSYIGVISAWLILAAILQPTKFLPFGMAVLVVGVVAVSTYSTMTGAAAKLKEKVEEAVNRLLQMKMRAAIEKIEREAWEKLIELEGGLASDLDEQTPEEKAKLDEMKEKSIDDVTPLDIFMAVNTEGKDHLKMKDFKRIFELLELDITEAQKEQLFAFCDTDCSGEISEKEFQEGWDMMLEVLLENAADSLGLSKAQIIMACVYILTILVLLVFFILLTIGAWNNESSFNAIVQSALISGVGKATTALRQKSKAESSENLGDIVEGLIDNQKEAADEAKA